MEDNNFYSIVLDDGIEYLIYDTELIDDIEYTLFVNTDNDADICFRKTISINNEEFFVKIDDDREYEKVLFHFTKKNLN